MVFKKSKPKKEDSSKKDFSDRKMIEGNWTCAECGTKITELPFEPSPDNPVYCRECWLKRRNRGTRRDFAPRKTIQGNWKCSECGTEITELPFEPAPDRPIYCRDCWAKQRTQRF